MTAKKKSKKKAPKSKAPKKKTRRMPKWKAPTRTGQRARIAHLASALYEAEHKLERIRIACASRQGMASSDTVALIVEILAVIAPPVVLP